MDLALARTFKLARREGQICGLKIRFRYGHNRLRLLYA